MFIGLGKFYKNHFKMTIEPQVKISLLTFGTIIFGLFIWRLSNKIFSTHNRSKQNKFDNSEYRKRWKKK